MNKPTRFMLSILTIASLAGTMGASLSPQQRQLICANRAAAVMLGVTSTFEADMQGFTSTSCASIQGLCSSNASGDAIRRRAELASLKAQRAKAKAEARVQRTCSAAVARIERDAGCPVLGSQVDLLGQQCVELIDDDFKAAIREIEQAADDSVTDDEPESDDDGDEGGCPND